MPESIAAGARPLLVAVSAMLVFACGAAPVEPTAFTLEELEAEATAPVDEEGELLGDGPLVLFAHPSNATEVRPDIVVKLIFNEPMDTAPTTAAIAVHSEQGDLILGQYSWDVAGMVVAFRPDAALDAGTYEVVVDETARDAEGDMLAERFAARFEVNGETEDSKHSGGG